MYEKSQRDGRTRAFKWLDSWNRGNFAAVFFSNLVNCSQNYVFIYFLSRARGTALDGTDYALEKRQSNNIRFNVLIYDEYRKRENHQ